MSHRTVEILKDLYFIERGYLNANHFVFAGYPPVLIDSGYLGDYEETVRRIEQTGAALKEIQTIYTTHIHCDHVGGNWNIHQRSGCDIQLHEIGRHFIETRDGWSTWYRYLDQQADYFPCSRSLKDGDEIEIGPHRFEVMHTPGHSADGTVYYNRREKLLISSDTLWEHDLAVHIVRVEGSAAVIHSLKSLDRLSQLDVHTVCPGHGKIFTDFRGALRRSRKRIESYLAEPARVGTDILKKIMVYTLLMHRHIEAEAFFDQLMKTIWFPETVDFYFEGAYRRKYDEIVEALLQKGAVQQIDGHLTTPVPP
jgi:glyoxylase-like metal-dependent hydrolase (beta-lactamase superfamily II)